MNIVIDGDARRKRYYGPRRWFAWHPVEVSPGKWVWLETVTRRRKVYQTISPTVPGGIYWVYGGHPE